MIKYPPRWPNMQYSIIDVHLWYQCPRREVDPSRIIWITNWIIVVACMVTFNSVVWIIWSLTCVQQQLHHTKVGVGDTVVESCVPIPIGHVDYVLQQHWRHLGERHQVVWDSWRLSHLGARDAEPLELDSVGAGELKVRVRSCVI